MSCCCNCEDYLSVPVGAVPNNQKYILEQKFPYICCNSQKFDDNIAPVCVKEFHEKKNRLFNAHLKIVTHFTTELNSAQILVRYSTLGVTYERAPLFGAIEQYDEAKPDIYYKIVGNKVEIYATHFTIFIIEKKKELTGVLSLCETQRFINLAADVYYAENVTNRVVTQHVYILDSKEANYNKLKMNIKSKEKATANTEIVIDGENLPNVPELIRQDTIFQCIAYCCKSTWKRMSFKVMV